MSNPYQNLPARNFWRSAVANVDDENIAGLWDPKFNIKKDDIIFTCGSCFAQHIGRALKANGYSWTNFEPAPPRMEVETERLFNYGIFSFRTGNIYTTPLLSQWIGWARGTTESDEVWERDGRFFDPFRPSIEPNGFSSPEEMRRSRKNTLKAINSAIKSANVMIFTLGLTEAWINKNTKMHYAACPGTIAGKYDESIHEFINLDYNSVRAPLEKLIKTLKIINPNLKLLLTVSPVPLTATAEREHVLCSTVYSKSTLRAVAGDLAKTYDTVDYFPSYEIISSFPFKARSFEKNLRSVTREGVAFVMSHFFSSLNGHTMPNDASHDHGGFDTENTVKADSDDVVCEEEILEFFNGN